MQIIWRKSIRTASLAVAAVACFAFIYTFQRQHSAAHASVATHNAAPRKSMHVKSGTVLANQDLIALAERKVSPKTIVRLIERHPCRFDASPDEMIRMKDGGVDEEVLHAVVVNLDHCETNPPVDPSVAHSADQPDESAPVAEANITADGH